MQVSTNKKNCKTHQILQKDAIYIVRYLNRMTNLWLESVHDIFKKKTKKQEKDKR